MVGSEFILLTAWAGSGHWTCGPGSEMGGCTYGINRIQVAELDCCITWLLSLRLVWQQ